MSTEEYAQRCLDLRGYLVVGTLSPMRIGVIATIDDQPGSASESKAVVVARTDRQDMVEQLRVMGETDQIIKINATHFYRMVAE